MFIKLHTALFEQTSLKHSEIILLSYILNCGYKKIKMSNEKLATLTGLSPRTVSRAVNSLAKQEYLYVTYGTWDIDKTHEHANKLRCIKPAVEIREDDEDSVNSDYMYNPMWKSVMGMSTGEAIVMAFLNSICRVRKTQTVSGFAVKDICDTLRLSYRIVSNAIKNLGVMGCLSHKKQEGSKYNEYTISVMFAKAEDEKELFDAFIDDPVLKQGIDDVLSLRETWLYVRGAFRRAFWERLDRRVNMWKWGEAWIRFSGGVKVA